MIAAIIKKILIKLGYYSTPGFLIVGAQKTGTTALFSMLKQHSRIAGADKKEIHFFDDDKQYAANRFDEYHLHFPLPYKLRNKIAFEASPSYLYHPEAAKRIKKYKPDIKIIIVLRKPEDRAFSAWSMYHYKAEQHKKYAYMHDARSFSEAIADELGKKEKVNWYTDQYSYVERGIYFQQVKQYMDNFPAEQILIIEHQELKNEHDLVIKKICSFLSIPYQPLKQQYFLQNVKNTKDEYQEELKKLNVFYKPHNELLFNLIKKSYNW